jgi:serine/threonine protein kinase
MLLLLFPPPPENSFQCSFRPPELLKDGLLTKAADVYAFGVLLWELYNGKRAWAGANVGQVIFAVTCRGEALVMPSSAPQDLQILVGSCLSSNYEDRPSFGQIVAELTRMKACAARAKMAT